MVTIVRVFLLERISDKFEADLAFFPFLLLITNYSEETDAQICHLLFMNHHELS